MHDSLSRAKMLDGREPQDKQEWAVLMNFVAANTHESGGALACRLIAKIYRMPLTDDEVDEIWDFQFARR